MQESQKDCVFCKIVSGDIPSHIYWQNDDAIAFLDIRPKVPGHTLVVPKNHHPYIFDISDAEYNKLLIATKFIAEKLKGFTGKNRICVIIEGFAVDHAHVHLIPANDPAEFGLPAMPGNMDELADLQSKLVKAINKN